MSKLQAKQPIVRVTRMTVAYSETGSGKERRIEPTRFTVYGADAQGVERIYVEHATEQEHQAWRDSDPLWKEAQVALFRRVLDDPGTRDAVLQLNIAAALKDGDSETAVELANRLSPQAWHRLLGHMEGSTEHDAGDLP